MSYNTQETSVVDRDFDALPPARSLAFAARGCPKLFPDSALAVWVTAGAHMRNGPQSS